MLYYDGETHDAASNLAQEEYIFSSLNAEAVSLWQNDSAVIVGKNQNAAAELDLDYAEKNGVRVVRRITGGGAVYHDLGNINYTIIQNDKAGSFRDFGFFARPIIDFLAQKGVKAELSGRNDITVGTCKISGGAQCVRGGRLLHHGTLLYSADLERMARILSPGEGKFEGKASRSVSSRVANISSFLADAPDCAEFLCELRSFLVGRLAAEPAALNDAQRLEVSALARTKYQSYEWNFGASPPYTWRNAQRFSFGGVELRLNVTKGIIRSAQIFGDFFGEWDAAKLCRALEGIRHDPLALRAALDRELVERCVSGMTLEQLLELCEA